MAKSSSKQTRGKPRKPSPDFPLFPHATGRWAKKIKGRFTYFGKVADDPKGETALALWLEQKDDLLAGRTPRPKAQGFTLRELLDRFMVAKRDRLDNGEITPHHFAELYATCKRIGGAFGLHRLVVDLGPDDFDRLRKGIARQWGPCRLATEIQRTRGVFKWGFESGLIAQAVRFGPGFRKPTAKTMRQNRASKPPRMFEPAELRALLGKAGASMKAMILLAVNCGYGNGDVANLPIKALDLDRGWVTFPRPKTGVERRCPLWPETVAAIGEALAQRRKPKSTKDAGIAFITWKGHRWQKIAVSEPDPKTGKIKMTNNAPVTGEFGKLLEALRLQQPGRGFYSLRHTFRTIADGCRDQAAANAIMGHVDESMAGAYRERIDDARLRAVVEHVHTWLFGSEGTK